MPQVNWALMVCTIADRHRLRIVERAGRRLRHRRHDDDGDHGDAAARRRDRALALAAGRWRCCVTGLFLTIDLAFFGANALKIPHGGWLPLVIGALLFTLMTTWKTGRRIVARAPDGARDSARGLHGRRRRRAPPARVPGTAVFMTAQPRGTPPALAHNLRHNKVLHEHVVVADGHDGAGAARARRAAGRPSGRSATASSTCRSRYGFMEDPNVPEALALARDAGARARRRRRHLFPRPRDAHRDPAPGHGASGASSCSC